MSRPDETHSIRVGLLLVVAVGLLGFGIWTLGDASRRWSRKSHYYVMFSNAQGLTDGSAVSVAGYTIGNVTGIRLPEDITAGLVRIDVAIQNANLRYVRGDTKARIKTIGLLGDKYIDLTPGTLGSEELPAGSEIPAVQPPNLDEIMAQGESVAGNLVLMTASLRQILDKIAKGEGLLGALIINTPEGQLVSADIKQAIAGLRAAAHNLDQGEGLIATLLKDKRPARDFRNAVASLSRVGDKLDKGDGLAARLLTDPDFARATFDDLEKASASLRDFAGKLNNDRGLVVRLTNDEAYAEEFLGGLNQAASAIASITRRIEEGEGSLGKLINDETLYRGVNDIVGGASKSMLVRWFVGRSQKSGAEDRLGIKDKKQK